MSESGPLTPNPRRRQSLEPKISPPWKNSLHLLLERPTSSSEAFLIHFATTGLIIFSGVVTIIETIPIFHGRNSNVWFGVETSLVVLFTIEYVARCIAWSGSWAMFWGWFKSFFSIIDLLAILPYYIEIAVRADTSSIFRFSIMRTFRLLRVFRPFRYSNTIVFTIEVMYLSFKRSKDALLALAFFVVTTLVVFSTLIYFSERGTWDDTLETFINVEGRPSQFESIPAAAWYVLVTISTVGFGEITPRSFFGRLFTVPLLLFGLLLIALPSFVLGREFSILWESMGGGRRDLPIDYTPFTDQTNPETPRVIETPIELTSREGSSSMSNSAIGHHQKLLESHNALARELHDTRADVASLRQEIRILSDLIMNTRSSL